MTEPARSPFAPAALVALLMSTAAAAAPEAPTRPPASDAVALGRYLVQTTGCNDCHTPGYTATNGKVPVKDWLTGDAVGWRGPWGTTYPTNLRLYFSGMTQTEWLARARTMEPRPPMPWFNLRAMSDADLSAIYRFAKAAGPAGQPAPAYVPPDGQPPQPYIQFPQ